jgi:hypothetical protein
MIFRKKPSGPLNGRVCSPRSRAYEAERWGLLLGTGAPSRSETKGIIGDGP